jgi:hypothetical protein
MITNGFVYAADLAVANFVKVPITIGGLSLKVLVDQVDSIMQSLPHLDIVDDFDLLHIDGLVPQFRIPTWIIVTLCVVAALLVVFFLVALYYEAGLVATRIIAGVTVASIVWFFLFLVELKLTMDALAVGVVLTYNTVAYLYLLSVVLAIAGVIMLYNRVGQSAQVGTTGFYRSTMNQSNSEYEPVPVADSQDRTFRTKRGTVIPPSPMSI